MDSRCWPCFSWLNQAAHVEASPADQAMPCPEHSTRASQARAETSCKLGRERGQEKEEERLGNSFFLCILQLTN